MSLDYHQRRVDRTLRSEGEEGALLDLTAELGDAPVCGGVLKARIVYDGTGKVDSKTYAPYTMRKVESLQLVSDDGIDYSFKREDRSRLNTLAAMKGRADEVIIVKEGRLTDTSYSNIALFDGKRWVTPERPLLNGTMRQRLIDEGRLAVAEICADDIGRYEQVCLINAMMPLGRCVVGISEVYPLEMPECR